MAGKNGQRIQTKRNIRNKYKWEKRTTASKLKQSKAAYYHFKSTVKNRVPKQFINTKMGAFFNYFYQW